ncbi:MAG TPA: hypothetical protein VFV93_15135 [Thermomicrobiales bacterium]|nr:hypothetical protein [Thermomicrobiales bacterium]
MFVDVETFLIAVYTLVDDLYQAHLASGKPTRRGCPPAVSDSEVLTLMLLGHWLGNSERGLLRHAHAYWRAYFPRLLSQRAFNRRARRLGSTCAALLQLVAHELQAETSAYQVADTVPVPLAQLCRGKHHRLFANDAAIGRGGSDKHFYYGQALLLAVSAEGVITGFVAGPASTEGRWLLDALLTWRANPAASPWTVADVPTERKRRGGYVGPTGPRWWPGTAGAAATVPYIADDGFCGAAWVRHWHDDLAATVFTGRGYGPTAPAHLTRSHHRWRQVIETVNESLNAALHLPCPRAKTPWGVITRLTAKCCAFNVGIWVNRLLGRAPLAIDTLFPA